MESHLFSFPLFSVPYVYSCITCGTALHWAARLPAYPALTLSFHNTNKNFKLKAFVANFIILLLFIEFLVNLIRLRILIFQSYNLTYSCQINDYPQYLYFSLPYTLSPSLHLCILPIVTLLISKNKFLDRRRPYKKRLRIGLGIIFCRFLVCFCLLSFFQIRILFYILYTCLYIIDYFMCLYYARTFH